MSCQDSLVVEGDVVVDAEFKKYHQQVIKTCWWWW